MKVSAYWISFESPPEWLSVQADELSIGNVVHVPAVRAEEHPDWISSGASGDSFAIGKGAAGCLLAHREAWSIIGSSTGDGYALILESDALPTNYARRYTALTLQTAISLQTNIVQMGSNRAQAKGSGKGSRLGSHVHDAIQMSEIKLLSWRSPLFHQTFAAGNHAYLVSSDYCRWLSTWEPDFKIPVDQWLHVLSRDPRHRIFRSRQDLWCTSGRASEIENFGR